MPGLRASPARRATFGNNSSGWHIPDRLRGKGWIMRISVFGIGYVGAVSSGCLAALGHRVVGVDVSPEKVAMLNSGASPIVEAEIGELIAGAVADGRLRATDDVTAAVSDTELSLISVGTPSAADGSVSLRAVDAVAQQIGAAIARKSAPHAVVMRSTVPPGAPRSG